MWKHPKITVNQCVNTQNGWNIACFYSQKTLSANETNATKYLKLQKLKVLQ